MVDHDLRNLDREIDAALTRYAAVEPRTGLEQRILANLQMERDRTAFHHWWRWPVVAAVALALIVFGLSLIWRSGPRKGTQAHSSPPAIQDRVHAGTEAAVHHGGNQASPKHAAFVKKPTAHTTSHPQVTADPVPRLEQFPSPQPLSEQEKILAGYVVQFQNQAVLVARARMESLLKDSIEEANNSSFQRENLK